MSHGGSSMHLGYVSHLILNAFLVLNFWFFHQGKTQLAPNDAITITCILKSLILTGFVSHPSFQKELLVLMVCINLLAASLDQLTDLAKIFFYFS